MTMLSRQPHGIRQTESATKIRSGKTMRLLRDNAEGRAQGDTLVAPSVVAGLKERYEASEG